ncbi:MAG TPA: anion permease, partial [Thermodesulfovibrionia bacterium]|nr:anion permease [Thermodesulfovibrionia bacterium]
MAEEKAIKGGLPESHGDIGIVFGKPKFDWKRLFFLLLGVGFFFLFYFLPPFEDAADPGGKLFTLTREGKAAIGLFLMAGTWWIFEVIPIGVTSIAIGVMQAMFELRKNPADAFRDFMDPSVMFIFGSIVVGLAFTKTGLTRRIAFLMLRIVGER